MPRSFMKGASTGRDARYDRHAPLDATISTDAAMQLPRSLLVPALALALVAAAAARPEPGPEPERLVSASITIDGKVVLRASTSDDGRPDADAVWGYLIGELEFRPTEDFAALGVDPAARTASFGWLRSRANEHLGEPPEIALEVDYGGRDAPFLLGLVRVEGTDAWRVDRETVEGRFPHRWIRRDAAARLVAPERRK